MIRALYFDIGNVILAFSHEQMCEQMARVASAEPQTIWDFLFEDRQSRAIQLQYETGDIDSNAYFDYLCSALGVRPDRRQLEHAVCDIFRMVPAMESLIRRLASSGNRLGLLSNTNPLQWNFFTDGRFPLLASPESNASPFQWAVLSFAVHSMKPDRRIYDVAVERAGALPEEVFFVDDRPENVAGALAAGIDAVLFRGADQLSKELAARNVAGALAAC